MPDQEARIDKWLWAARVYKTRSVAADACKIGHVTIKGARVKASKMVKVGDVVEVRKQHVTYSFQILQAIEKRVGAKLIPEVLKNVTPPSQLELAELARMTGFVDRAKGTGRPTKKDRRSLDEFFGLEFGFDVDEE